MFLKSTIAAAFVAKVSANNLFNVDATECWGKVMPDQSCGYGSICFGPNGWNHTEWGVPEGCMTCDEIGGWSVNANHQKYREADGLGR